MPQSSPIAWQPPAPRPPRRRRRVWIPITIVAVVVAAALVVALTVVPPMLARAAAEDLYRTAVDEHDAASAEWDATWKDAGAALRPARAAVDLAGAVATDEAKPYLDGEGYARVVELREDVAEIESSLPMMFEAMSGDDTPDETEEFREAEERLRDDTKRLRDRIALFSSAAAELDELTPELEEATAALRASIPGQADRIERENISAESIARIRVHAAAEYAATTDESVAYAVGEYAARAREVEASQEAELEEKHQGDGLFDVRLDIEEFVRSITGDARVDFDWAPIVNGLGAGESAGGVVTWMYSDGGYATMSLSNSIAAYWPDERFQSLVVHESGHVITSQCRDMLVDTFDGDVEMMATAWAIGMGYTNTWGNGVDFYYDGVWPPDHLVEASKSCR